MSDSEPVAVPMTVDGLFAIAAAIERLAAAVEQAGLPRAAGRERPQRQSVEVTGLTPDEVGIVAVRHNLDADRVAVRLFAPDGTRVVTRIITQVTRDEVEAIVEDGQPWPSRATVEVVASDDERLAAER